MMLFQDTVQQGIDMTYSIADESKERGHKAEALVIESGGVDDVLKEARKRSADLIVAGSHGHGAVYRAVMGSFCDKVISSSHCPVLVVPTRPNES